MPQTDGYYFDVWLNEAGYKPGHVDLFITTPPHTVPGKKKLDDLEAIYIAKQTQFLKDVETWLAPTGHMFYHHRITRSGVGASELTDMHLIDIIHWDKLFLGATSDRKFRCVGEPVWWFAKSPNRYFFVNINLSNSFRGHASATVNSIPHLPEGLVANIIRCTTSKGDIVVDPFDKTGVVMKVAESLGRVGIGFRY